MTEDERAIAHSVFDLEACLPDQVFREGFGGFRSTCYDDVFTTRFWRRVLEAARGDGGEVSVLVNGLADDERLLRFSSEDDPFDCVDKLLEWPDGEPSVSVIGDVLAVFPPSGAWGVYCCRDYETCLFAHREEGAGAAAAFGQWPSTDMAVAGWMQLPFRGQVVPPDIAARFLEEYPPEPGGGDVWNRIWRWGQAGAPDEEYSAMMALCDAALPAMHCPGTLRDLVRAADGLPDDYPGLLGRGAAARVRASTEGCRTLLAGLEARWREGAPGSTRNYWDIAEEEAGRDAIEAVVATVADELGVPPTPPAGSATRGSGE